MRNYGAGLVDVRVRDREHLPNCRATESQRGTGACNYRLFYRNVYLRWHHHHSRGWRWDGNQRPRKRRCSDENIRTVVLASDSRLMRTELEFGRNRCRSYATGTPE